MDMKQAGFQVVHWQAADPSRHAMHATLSRDKINGDRRRFGDRLLSSHVIVTPQFGNISA